MSADVSLLNAQLHNRIFRTLTGFVEEFRAASVRILAYLCGVLALALIAADLMGRVRDDMDMVPQPAIREAHWRAVERPVPAFSAPVPDLAGRSTTYEILRHPEGGRKDTLRWTGEGAFPLAVIEIYRPGAELTGLGPATLEVGERIAPWNGAALQTTGVIETKFGPVTLVGFQAAPAEAGDVRICTAFVRQFETPLFQISGWSCQGDAAQASNKTTPQQVWIAQRQSVACLLNRLTLLAAGSDPKLAEAFAHAELKRSADCSGAVLASIRSTDWITAAERPQLRGAVALRD